MMYSELVALVWISLATTHDAMSGTIFPAIIEDAAPMRQERYCSYVTEYAVTHSRGIADI